MALNAVSDPALERRIMEANSILRAVVGMGVARKPSSKNNKTVQHLRRILSKYKKNSEDMVLNENRNKNETKRNIFKKISGTGSLK